MLNDIITPRTALFADKVQTVLRGHENRKRRVVLLKGSLVQNSRAESRGISARVNKNGRYGFSSVASYTEKDAELVLKCATENALFLDARAGAARPGCPGGPRERFSPALSIADTGQKRIIDFCRALDDHILQACPDLLSRTVVYSEDSQDKIIASSDASCGHVTTPRCYIYVTLAAASKQGAPVELFRAFGGRGGFDDQFSRPEDLYGEIALLYQCLKDKTEGVYAQAGEKTVILGGMMGGMLAHEAVGHTVEADLVMGGSVAGPALGKRVGADLVTLVDYAQTAFGETGRGTVSPKAVWA